jgi:hypothetical protein
VPIQCAGLPRFTEPTDVSAFVQRPAISRNIFNRFIHTFNMSSESDDFVDADVEAILDTIRNVHDEVANVRHYEAGHDIAIELRDVTTTLCNKWPQLLNIYRQSESEDMRRNS